ncbi:DUF2938 domain-containing protein [Achromobacter sp.]|uniref:DUF2938 domain-containing protein n=1 Tax=Achromobacter sp. TaxID=134375 RepID=UPI0028AE4023|nr:DUF2938 domain-containing protein [Achromobacter sp.]
MAWMDVIRVALVGVGATAIMDVWSLTLRRLGVPTLDYALVGRWAGHLCRGRFAHASIGRAPPVPGERPVGWAIHYGTGLAFAGLLIAVQGGAWLHDPAFLPAVAVGVATVVVPWFVIQPAMGAGFMSAKTPTPLKNCLRSLATHGVFGAGLYLSAAALQLLEAMK